MSSGRREPRRELNTELARFWLPLENVGREDEGEEGLSTKMLLFSDSSSPRCSVVAVDRLVMSDAVRRFRRRFAGSSSSLLLGKLANAPREARPKKLRRLLSLDMPSDQVGVGRPGKLNRGQRISCGGVLVS